MYEKKSPKFRFLTKNRNETFTILNTEKSINGFQLALGAKKL